MKKILITGTNGMLGKDVYAVLSRDDGNIIYAINRKKDISISNSFAVDITNYHYIAQIINDVNPDVVVHTAALTDVDYCEKNKEKAYEVNVNASKNLAGLCEQIIYISTDAVYNGFNGNFTENDMKKPINYYAETKSIAEDEILKANPNSVIARTNIYGFHNPIGNSLFEWAYDNLNIGNKINGFDDVFFNPVYTKQLAVAIAIIIEKDFSGVINIGCEKTTSKYELLIKFAKAFNLDERLITPMSVDNVSLKAKRPKNTTLDLKKMKKVLGTSFSIDSGVNELYQDHSKAINK